MRTEDERAIELNIRSNSIVIVNTLLCLELWVSQTFLFFKLGKLCLLICQNQLNRPNSTFENYTIFVVISFQKSQNRALLYIVTSFSKNYTSSWHLSIKTPKNLQVKHRIIQIRRHFWVKFHANRGAPSWRDLESYTTDSDVQWQLFVMTHDKYIKW